ncbi:DUF6215 domain-containing protein [Streptomyces sp. H39-S7]|uniref:DUF6215 domain-containing protein n=1 Tax=Streptomyces sp. H39-S7 TaxID=3004357 RepID=UPI0022AEAEA9|nr:DUF6215 domain-containing protein [Streptomyces sp. H39-S7]MCZ4121854.1 DUF6215 domain-containing protein [Streptomyces sp. H39-S7]
MADDFAGSKQGMNAGAQAVAAVVLVSVVAGGIRAVEAAPDASGDRGPAVCSAADQTLPPQYVSGAGLCEALNRPDLPALLGTPADHAETAWGGGGWITPAGSVRTAAPEGNVRLETYSVKVSASYDQLPVTRLAALLGRTAQVRTVLGHPAVLYSDRTFAIAFDGGGGKASSGPGGIARHLVVAQDAKDGGGSYEVAIWRQDDVLPDDAALFRVAEKVLPTIPGWTAG